MRVSAAGRLSGQASPPSCFRNTKNPPESVGLLRVFRTDRRRSRRIVLRLLRHCLRRQQGKRCGRRDRLEKDMKRCGPFPRFVIPAHSALTARQVSTACRYSPRRHPSAVTIRENAPSRTIAADKANKSPRPSDTAHAPDRSERAPADPPQLNPRLRSRAFAFGRRPRKAI